MRTAVAALLVAGCGFTASSPAIDGGATDGLTLDAPPGPISLFVADFGSNQLHRYQLVPQGGAPLPASFPISGALSPFVHLASDELFVGKLATGAIERFATPLGTPTSTGAITTPGLAPNIGKMALVDDELWVVVSGAGSVVRVVFDGAGVARTVATFSVPNARGIVFVPGRRDIYITQCCGTNTVRHYRVGADLTMSALPSLTGSGLANPHGMVVTPWNELFVANAADASVLRFQLDANGTPTPNGRLTGNALAVPIDLLLTPWNELIVTNQGGNLISRFVFDAQHTASSHGTLTVPNAQSVCWGALY